MKLSKIVFLSSLVVLVAAGCNQKTEQQNQEAQNTNQEQNQNPEQNNEESPQSNGEMVEYKNSFKSGFEETIYSVTYSLKYPKDAFSIAPAANNKSQILVKETATGKTHEINVFNNVGAGFANVNEFWSAKKYCPDCKKTTGSINIAGAKNVQVYENASSQWYVYAKDPGFVAIKIEKPVDEAKKVMETLQLDSFLIQ